MGVQEEEAGPATLAVATATCLATAPRANNVTTVSLANGLTDPGLNDPTGSEVDLFGTSLLRVCKQPGHVRAA